MRHDLREVREVCKTVIPIALSELQRASEKDGYSVFDEYGLLFLESIDEKESSIYVSHNPMRTMFKVTFGITKIEEVI